jgi:hypothetical protein
MENGFDYACKINNNWDRNLRPYVDSFLSFLIKKEMNIIKKNCQDKEYDNALPIVQTLIEGFNPNDYNFKPWSNSAKETLTDLKGLETFLKESIKESLS